MKKGINLAKFVRPPLPPPMSSAAVIYLTTGNIDHRRPVEQSNIFLLHGVMIISKTQNKKAWKERRSHSLTLYKAASPKSRADLFRRHSTSRSVELAGQPMRFANLRLLFRAWSQCVMTAHDASSDPLCAMAARKDPTIQRGYEKINKKSGQHKIIQWKLNLLFCLAVIGHFLAPPPEIIPVGHFFRRWMKSINRA